MHPPPDNGRGKILDRRQRHPRSGARSRRPPAIRRRWHVQAGFRSNALRGSQPAGLHALRLRYRRHEGRASLEARILTRRSHVESVPPDLARSRRGEDERTLPGEKSRASARPHQQSPLRRPTARPCRLGSRRDGALLCQYPLGRELAWRDHLL